MEMPPWEVMAPENRRVVVEIGGNINGLPFPKREIMNLFFSEWAGDCIKTA